MVLSGRIGEVASPRLVQEVFSIMKRDTVGMLVRNDSLIISLGNQCLAQNIGNVLMRGKYTSGTLRLVANMLSHLKHTKVDRGSPFDVNDQNSQENDLWDYIRPQQFDLCIQSALETAMQSMEDIEDLKSLSNGIKLGYELQKLNNIKLGMAIRTRDITVKEECQDFRKLIKNEWGIRVTRLAQVNLAKRQFQMEKNLPLPEDVKKLNVFLKTAIENFDSKDRSFVNFRLAVKLVEAKLIMYNRRRSGEIKALRWVMLYDIISLFPWFILLLA